MNQPGEEAADRLREKPEERFAAPQHLFDFHAILEQLRAEPHAGQHGHRQETVYHHGSFTLILFSFDAGGSLPDHHANGTVTIQALEGRFRVRANDEEYTVVPGKMAVLASNTGHSVTADEPGALLVSVFRDGQTG